MKLSADRFFVKININTTYMCFLTDASPGRLIG